MVDFGGGDVDEAGLISIDVEAGDGADDLAALVADGESVAEDGGVGGESREVRAARSGEPRECELDRFFMSCSTSGQSGSSGAKARNLLHAHRSAEALRSTYKAASELESQP